MTSSSNVQFRQQLKEFLRLTAALPRNFATLPEFFPSIRAKVQALQHNKALRRVALASGASVVLFAGVPDVAAVDVYDADRTYRTINNPWMSPQDKAVEVGVQIWSAGQRAHEERKRAEAQKKAEEERKNKDLEATKKMENSNDQLRKAVQEEEERVELLRRQKKAREELKAIESQGKSPFVGR